MKCDTSLGYLLGESGAPNGAQGGLRATLVVIIDCLPLVVMFADYFSIVVKDKKKMR